MVHVVSSCGRASGPSLLPALAVALAFGATPCRADETLEASAWTSPVRVAATICQGNGGSRSHTDAGSFYAWDYDVEEGTPIVAARGGVVLEVIDHHTLGGSEPRYRDQANRIVLKHADGLRSVYAHLRPGGVTVRAGERVLRGELIGWSGNTGYSSAPHLHFAVVDSQGISVPIQFADFELGDGVPWDGDRHGAAPRPVLAQKEIDAGRARIRAAGKALAEGWPDVGLLALAGRRPVHKRVEHPLVRELDELEASCRASLEQLADAVLDSPEPDPETVFRLVRATVAADQARAPHALRSRLHRARRVLKGDASEYAAALNHSTSRLLRGMVRECRGEEQAASDYAALLKDGATPIRRLARARFDHLVETALASYGRVIVRLQESAREADARHGSGLLQYVERTLDVHRALLEQAGRAWTDRAPEIRAVLTRMRDDAEEIATLLG